MFGRKHKIKGEPGFVLLDENRPVAVAAWNLVDLMSTSNMHAAVQLMLGRKFSDETWFDVLVAYIEIAHMTPAVRNTFDQWIAGARAERGEGLRMVRETIDKLDAGILERVDDDAKMNALFGLATAIGVDPTASLRLVMWRQTGDGRLASERGLG